MDAYRSGQFNLDQLDMIIIEHDFFYITKDGLNSTCVAGEGIQFSKAVTTNSVEGNSPAGLL